MMTTKTKSLFILVGVLAIILILSYLLSVSYIFTILCLYISIYNFITINKNKILSFFEARGINLDLNNIQNEIDDVLPDKENYTQIAGKSTEDLKGLIKTGNIAKKIIYYNDNEKTDISQIMSLLHDNAYKSVCVRLREKNLKTGFACLFSGAAGTGKTETVYQLARETGRDIIKVDISTIHSSVFGQDEKNIKAVFTRYKSLLKKYKKTPILFFNEADGIFNKRLAVGNNNSNSAAILDNNNMQNVILEELENMEGILIATTNMVKNLDPAFERRFIYKIEFSRPNSAGRAAIWKLFIPELTEEMTRILSERFSLSGGQIENVARKNVIHFAVSGREPDTEKLFAWCKQEDVLSRDGSFIVGFSA
jgi:SpoVK/Ycf46/Vps4 family AAA+-type ATPase